MTVLEFTIQFYAPVLRATGHAMEGFDASVDLDRPVSAEAVKGAMRHAAEHVLALPTARVERAYEPREHNRRWHWRIRDQRFHPPSERLAAHLTDARAGVAHRVAIHPETHTAVQDHLLRARTARLDRIEVEIAWLGQEESDPEDALLLRASAGALQALGAQRTRGLGWAGVDLPDPTEQDIDTLLRWRCEKERK